MSEDTSEVRYASLWERVAARAFDVSVVHLPITVIFSLAAGGGVDKATPAQALVLGLTVLVVALIQEHLLTTFWGATLGKKLLRLQVQGVDGAPPTTLQLLGRLGVPLGGFLVLPGVLGFAALLACLVQTGERRQGVHDRVARTVVVKTD